MDDISEANEPVLILVYVWIYLTPSATNKTQTPNQFS